MILFIGICTDNTHPFSQSFRSTPPPPSSMLHFPNFLLTSFCHTKFSASQKRLPGNKRVKKRISVVVNLLRKKRRTEDKYRIVDISNWACSYEVGFKSNAFWFLRTFLHLDAGKFDMLTFSNTSYVDNQQLLRIEKVASVYLNTISHF